MTIDLMSLAKKADETYKDVKCSFGPVRVYHVPEIQLLSVRLDRPEPEIPQIRMKTTRGIPDQYRDAKRGDKEHSDYLKERDDYYTDLIELRGAVGAVEALKDIDWSKYDLSRPPPSKAATAMYNGHWPENEWLRKRAWLEWTYFLIQSDKEIILKAVNEMRDMSEPTEDDINEVKKNSV